MNCHRKKNGNRSQNVARKCRLLTRGLHNGIAIGKSCSERLAIDGAVNRAILISYQVPFMWSPRKETRKASSLFRNVSYARSRARLRVAFVAERGLSGGKAQLRSVKAGDSIRRSLLRFIQRLRPHFREDNLKERSFTP